MAGVSKHKSLYMTGLRQGQVADRSLLAYFGRFGRAIDLSWHPTAPGGRDDYARVEMASSAMAYKVLSAVGHVVEGFRVNIKDEEPVMSSDDNRSVMGDHYCRAGHFT